MSVSGTLPSARYGATLISDTACGRLLLFGGQGQRARAGLWQLGPAVTPSDAQPSGSIDQG